MVTSIPHGVPRKSRTGILNIGCSVRVISYIRAVVARASATVPPTNRTMAGAAAIANPPSPAVSVPGRPLVSVLMPTYNRLPILKQAVAALEAQTWQHMEVIIIDDGSTDGTLDRLRSLASASGRSATHLRRQFAYDRLLARLFHAGTQECWGRPLSHRGAEMPLIKEKVRAVLTGRLRRRSMLIVMSLAALLLGLIVTAETASAGTCSARRWPSKCFCRRHNRGPITGARNRTSRLIPASGEPARTVHADRRTLSDF